MVIDAKLWRNVLCYDEIREEIDLTRGKEGLNEINSFAVGGS
jgi:hypothetical protein